VGGDCKAADDFCAMAPQLLNTWNGLFAVIPTGFEQVRKFKMHKLNAKYLRR